MGPFETSVITLGESRSSSDYWRNRVLRAVSEALDADDTAIFEKAAKAWLEFEPKIEDALSDRGLWKFRGGSTVVAAFRDLAFYVLRTRQPPRTVKNLPSIAKLFTTVRRQPRDVKAFFHKRRQAMRTLLQAKNWDLADPGITVEGITVQDTTGKGNVDQIVKLVQSVASHIKRSGLPNVRSILYGQVLITAALTVRNSLAFYRREQDTVWIRPKTRWGAASEHSLAHEFGHRYWQKFLRTGHDAWKRWDRELRMRAEYQSFEHGKKLPDVGEPLPMPVRGHGPKPPTVIRIEGDKFYIADRKFLTRKQIRSFHLSRAKEEQFPTEYALNSGDHEEHFCEAFAMRVLGTLEEPHLSKFREIFA